MSASFRAAEPGYVPDVVEHAEPAPERPEHVEPTRENVPVVVELGGVTSGCWGIVGSACDTLFEAVGAGLIGGRFFECDQLLLDPVEFGRKVPPGV